MKTLLRDESRKLWNQYWDGMTEEWFKIEVLQDYSGEDDSPSLTAWKAGDTAKSEQLFRTDVIERAKDWQEECQGKVKSGVKLIRIHVIEEPHTPYIDWELMVYKLHNIPLCGEQVSLVSRSDTKRLEIPSGDIMIFDEKRVVANTYNDKGLMVQADFFDIQEGDDISRFLKLKTELLKYAQPVK